MYYQYEGARHFTRNVAQYLNEKFPDGTAMAVHRIGHHNDKISVCQIYMHGVT
jgi:hypothetical protein